MVTIEIRYWNGNEFRKEELEHLFLAVGWESGRYPDQLTLAMKNSDRVISAWDGEQLVGLINALSDGVMTVYLHYLLVHPNYQGKGIGKKLMKVMLGEFRDYLRVVLVSYHGQTGFYERCGFKINDKAQAMVISNF